MSTKLTIGNKLLLCFGAMLALTLALGFGSLYSIYSLSGELDHTIASTAKKQVLAGKINTATVDMLRRDNEIILRSMLQDTARMEQARRGYADDVEQIRRSMRDIEPLLETDAGRKSHRDTSTALDAVSQAHEQMLQLLLAQQGDVAMKLFSDRVIPLSETMSRGAEDLVRTNVDIMAVAQQQSSGMKARFSFLCIGMIVLSLGMGGVIFFLVNSITSGLRELAVNLASASEQVTSAAGQISGSSQGLAQGASEQAASLEETSASTEEMSSMTRRNAENSDSAALLVGESGRRVEEANRNLTQLVTAMGEINTSSEKISKIIKVIDEIAFQTNILALNAAVEAARAGEAGLGFAVVADEVRNLAQRCAQAAKDTAGLIEESIIKTTDGGNRLKQMETSIVGITTDSTKIKTLVDEVNLGSQEQSRGIEQIARAIVEMEKVTQRTAANAEESASAGEELNSQASQLLSLVHNLRDLVGGEQPRASTAGHAVRKAVALPKVLAKKRETVAALPLDNDFSSF
jgi:methyl-accepting chemotaxis protein